MKSSSAEAGQAAAKDPSAGAWGFLMLNLLVLPGLGSIAAGRRVGYAQALLALAGLVSSSWFVVVAAWALLAHRAALVEAAASGALIDRLETVAPAWRTHLIIGAVGLAVFLVSWLWALATSVSLLRAASAAVPPALVHP